MYNSTWIRNAGFFVLFICFNRGCKVLLIKKEKSSHLVFRSVGKLGWLLPFWKRWEEWHFWLRSWKVGISWGGRSENLADFVYNSWGYFPWNNVFACCLFLLVTSLKLCVLLFTFRKSRESQTISRPCTRQHGRFPRRWSSQWLLTEAPSSTRASHSTSTLLSPAMASCPACTSLLGKRYVVCLSLNQVYATFLEVVMTSIAV